MFGHIPDAFIMSEARSLPPRLEGPALIKGPGWLAAAASKSAPRLLPDGRGADLKDPGVACRSSCGPHLLDLSFGGGAEGVEKLIGFEGLESPAGGRRYGGG